MTQTHPRSWLWFTVAACGLLALVACQEPGQVNEPAEAAEAVDKVAPSGSTLVEAKTEAASHPGTPSTPQTVRGPKVTEPVEEIPFQGKRIAIVHTANVIGELEPCG